MFLLSLCDTKQLYFYENTPKCIKHKSPTYVTLNILYKVVIIAKVKLDRPFRQFLKLLKALWAIENNFLEKILRHTKL